MNYIKYACMCLTWVTQRVWLTKGSCGFCTQLQWNIKLVFKICHRTARVPLITVPMIAARRRHRNVGCISPTRASLFTTQQNPYLGRRIPDHIIQKWIIIIIFTIITEAKFLAIPLFSSFCTTFPKIWTSLSEAEQEDTCLSPCHFCSCCVCGRGPFV